MKKCKDCKKEKPLDSFLLNHRLTDGHLSFCRDCMALKNGIYYQKNKARFKEYSLIPKNRERKLRLKKEWDIKNVEHIKQYRKDYSERRSMLRSERYKNDVSYRLESIIRRRILGALQNNRKSTKSAELLGCSINELKRHLESKFKKGMSWSNHGKWHIDHIQPCASFDLVRPEQQKKCFNYSNLQPLWALENQIKGCNIGKS